MNYLKQITRFYELLPSNPLSPNAQCLYFYLLNLNNRLGWKKTFSVANSIVSGYTSMDISALQRARNALVQKGYIKYEKGKSNIAGTYEVVEFEADCKNQNDSTANSTAHNKPIARRTTNR